MSHRVAQLVSAGEQLGPQLGILEELAVECNPDRAVLVTQRLPTPREVDDRQTASPQRHARLAVELLVVGAAMGDRARHRLKALPGKLAHPPQIERTGDATHAEASQ